MTSTVDPTVWGPGEWNWIHTNALQVCTLNAAYYFASRLRQRCNSLPCQNCRQHAMSYLSSNPPEQWAVQFNDDTAMFRYTVEMHNYVNRRLGKPIISMDQAHQIWGVSRCQRPSSAKRAYSSREQNYVDQYKQTPQYSSNQNDCNMQ